MSSKVLYSLNCRKKSTRRSAHHAFLFEIDSHSTDETAAEIVVHIARQKARFPDAAVAYTHMVEGTNIDNLQIYEIDS